MLSENAKPVHNIPARTPANPSFLLFIQQRLLTYPSPLEL